MMQSKRFLPSLLALVFGLVMLNGVRLSVLAQTTVTIERISVDSGERQLTTWSDSGSLSADGRYAVFKSVSVEVRDRQLGETLTASVDSNNAPVNALACRQAISDDGRYVAYGSAATNIVPNDTNDKPDIFVYDRDTGETTRVSVASDGTQANRESNSCAISSTGRYVVFASPASNLVTPDTNDPNDPDVFVHDLDTGETTRVSVSSDGIEGNDVSKDPTISSDGRFVAFYSAASNLVPGDTNGVEDIFVHDRDSGETTLITVSTSGMQAQKGGWGAMISANGRYVTFVSGSSDLVPEDGGWFDIFVRDLQTGETTRVSVSSSGVPGNNHSLHPAISADGRFVAFESWASTLVGGDTNGFSDVFVHDRDTGQTQRISLTYDGLQANYYVEGTAISADGNVIAFQSSASNLVPGDTNNTVNAFVVAAPFPASIGPDPTEETTSEATSEVTIEPTTEVTPEVTDVPTPEITPEATDAPDAIPHRQHFTTHTPTLTWNRVSWALHYDIQIAETTNFSTSLIYEGSTTGPELEHLVTQSLENGRYYWRVRGVSANSEGSWSRPDEFVVDAD